MKYIYLEGKKYCAIQRNDDIFLLYAYDAANVQYIYLGLKFENLEEIKKYLEKYERRNDRTL